MSHLPPAWTCGPRQGLVRWPLLPTIHIPSNPERSHVPIPQPRGHFCRCLKWAGGSSEAAPCQAPRLSCILPRPALCSRGGRTSRPLTSPAPWEWSSTPGGQPTAGWRGLEGGPAVSWPPRLSTGSAPGGPSSLAPGLRTYQQSSCSVGSVCPRAPPARPRPLLCGRGLSLDSPGVNPTRLRLRSPPGLAWLSGVLRLRKDTTWPLFLAGRKVLSRGWGPGGRPCCEP